MINPILYHLTASEIAEALHIVSKPTVRRWIDEEKLPVLKRGRIVGVSLDNLRIFIQLNTVRERPDWPEIRQSFDQYIQELFRPQFDLMRQELIEQLRRAA